MTKKERDTIQLISIIDNTTKAKEPKVFVPLTSSSASVFLNC